MMPVAVDRIITSDELLQRLTEVLDTTVRDKFWVIVDEGKPRAAVVDVEFLDDLIRNVWFDSLADYTHNLFRQHLVQRGLNPDELSEAQIEEILHD